MGKILLVEDDYLVADAVQDSLCRLNYTIEWIDEGVEGLSRLSTYDYDLAIVDLRLPGINGFEICRRYRAGGGNAPILILTGERAEREKVEGFDSGADDYLTKPFSMKELASRIHALLRRARNIQADVVKRGDFEFDLARKKLTIAGRQVPLVPMELSVMEFLVRHPNRSFTAKELLNKVWNSESDSTESAVRVCIMRLRKKMVTANRNSFIQNTKGLGYRFANTD